MTKALCFVPRPFCFASSHADEPSRPPRRRHAAARSRGQHRRAQLVEHLERGLVAADAEHDEIVVALIDRSEATLKRITQRPEQSILTQLHSTMEPLGYPP